MRTKVTVGRLFCLSFLVCCLAWSKAIAIPNFVAGKKYRIVCSQFANGCVVEGSFVNQQTPVYYSTTKPKPEDDYAWWIITEEEQGLFSIMNAETGNYVTYDGIRDDYHRYVDLTTTLDGDFSLWTIVENGSGQYSIRNVGKDDHIWDVRVANYMVGTYSNTGAGKQNQTFTFVDENGTIVQEALPEGDATPLSAALDNLLFNMRGLAYDKYYKTYLYTTPLNTFGQKLSTTVNYTLRNGWGLLTIDGTVVEAGAVYDFDEVAGDVSHTLSITRTDGSETVSATVKFTSLPIVQLYGSFGNDYSMGAIRVFEPDKPQPELLRQKAKWRGGITNLSDKHKRNYHVKFIDEEGNKADQRFFGLRNDNSWILEACQVDMSRVRNRVLTDLWNDFATKPYYYDQEPKAMSGTRGQFVELILNDQYAGIYCMTEAIDRKQMKLKKYDEVEQEIHGQLWKSKDWSYAVFMGHNRDNNTYPGTSPAATNANSESWDQYYVKYPDIDDVKPTDWSTLYNAVNFVCTASNTRFTEQFADYFDFPVVIDYYIFLETILSSDNHGKNMYFACYDKQQDKRITFGIWDLDATTGQRWSDAYYHNTTIMNPEADYATYITTYEHGDYNIFRRLRNCNVDDFNTKIRYRYRDLRKSYFQTENILQRFRNYLDEFKTSGAATRERRRWSGDTDINRLSLNFDSEMTYITDWITRRMNYLDTQRFDIASLPESSGINDVPFWVNAEGNTLLIQSHTNAIVPVYHINGTLVRRVHVKAGTTEISLPAGLYIVGKRKVWVK